MSNAYNAKILDLFSSADKLSLHMENCKVTSLSLEIMNFIKVGVVSHQYSLELSELSQYEDTVLHSAQRIFFNRLFCYS